jgi:type VI secretion system VasI family protein
MIHKALFTLAILVFTTPVAFAQKVTVSDSESLEEAVGKCVYITKTIERLECYDDAARDFDIMEAEDLDVIDTDLDTGRWTIKSEFSDLDNKRTYFLSLDSEERATYNDGTTSRPLLVISCIADKRNDASLYIVWDKQLAPKMRSIYIKTRFDREAQYAEHWSLSSDKKATFSPEPRAVIRDMIKSRYLRVDALMSKYNTVNNVTFDLTGFKNAVRVVKDECGWR